MLLFIDTNIFLDFYRFEKSVSYDYVEKSIGVSDNIIMTHIVEMEFLKNRQKVLKNTLKEIKPPLKINFPEILTNDKTANSIPKQISNIKNKVHKIKQKVDKIVIDYDKNDKLYKKLKKIFQKDDEITLKLEKDIFDEIYSRAEKRFNMGYPPRKDSDLSFGDAINWEWVIEVCKMKRSAVIIVTRDSDYGTLYSSKLILNDYLKEEFKRRVPGNKKITLSTSLTRTLKDDFDVDITQDEIVYERRHMSPLNVPWDINVTQVTIQIPDKDLTRILRGLNPDRQYELLESIVANHINEIVDLHPILELITSTNAVGWGIDEFTIDTTSIEETETYLSISFSLTPYEHLDDRPLSGDQIKGNLDVIIEDSGFITFRNINAELNL